MYGWYHLHLALVTFAYQEKSRKEETQQVFTWWFLTRSLYPLQIHVLVNKSLFGFGYLVNIYFLISLESSLQILYVDWCFQLWLLELEQVAKKKKCELTSKISFNQCIFGVKVDLKTSIKIRQVYIAFDWNLLVQNCEPARIWLW